MLFGVRTLRLLKSREHCVLDQSDYFLAVFVQALLDYSFVLSDGFQVRFRMTLSALLLC